MEVTKAGAVMGMRDGVGGGVAVGASVWVAVGVGMKVGGVVVVSSGAGIASLSGEPRGC